MLSGTFPSSNTLGEGPFSLETFAAMFSLDGCERALKVAAK
jgi:hypothetical protein